MKIRNLILLGVVAAAVFAIALLPASLVWRSMSGALAGMPWQVERVGGSIWNGYALAQLRSPVLQGPVVLDWDLQGLRLLLGELAVQLRLEGSAFQVQGSGHWGLWGKGVADLNGEMRASLLDQSLRQFGVSASGVLALNDISVNLADHRITRAEGKVAWSGGAVTAPGRSVNDPIDFPAVDGVVREEDGNLYLTVTERQGNQFLAEAGLLPEQGLWSVKAVQRVLKLAGMSNNGDDDRILVNMQRPLP